jgi:hypothetical protein
LYESFKRFGVPKNRISILFSLTVMCQHYLWDSYEESSLLEQVI